jgi:hypothetical protein
MTGVVEMTMEQWKKTHKDYKGITNGQRSVLRQCGDKGTCIVPVKIIKKIV